MHPDTATTVFERLYRAAGLPPIRLHDLRHAAASLALKAGVPLKVVSEKLGHSSLAITADTYTSVLPAVAQATADAVADIVPRDRSRPADAAAFTFCSHEAQEGARMKIEKPASLTRLAQALAVTPAALQSPTDSPTLADLRGDTGLTQRQLAAAAGLTAGAYAYLELGTTTLRPSAAVALTAALGVDADTVAAAHARAALRHPAGR